MTNLTEGSLKRRAFLGIAAGGAAAVAVPGIARAATGQRSATSSILARAAGPTAGRLDRPRPGPGRAPWSGPARPATPPPSLLFDPRFDGQHPAGIAYVKNAARRVDLPGVRPQVRASRSPPGPAATATPAGQGIGGLIIDVSATSRRSRVSGIDRDGRRGHQAHRLLPRPGGQGPGGAGRVLPDGRHRRAHPGRRHRRHRAGLRPDLRQPGVAADRHRERRGAHRRRHPHQYSDLFWACQGGGGGNFGVVTSFTFRTVPAPEPVLFSLSWPWSQAARVVAAWQSWAPHAPGRALVEPAPGGGARRHARRASRSAAATWAATATRRTCSTSCTRRSARSPSSHFLSFPQPFLTAMLVEAGCSSHRLPGLPPALVRERRQALRACRSSPSPTSSPAR